MVWRFVERESDVKKWLGVLLLPFLCGASIAQTAEDRSEAARILRYIAQK